MTDKIMEARRAKFEGLFPMPYFVTWNTDRHGYYSILRDSARKRTAENYDAKWEGYNAALDSLCVELPHIYEIAYHEEDGDGSWKAMTADRVIEAIHAAGVKTK